MIAVDGDLGQAQVGTVGDNSQYNAWYFLTLKLTLGPDLKMD